MPRLRSKQLLRDRGQEVAKVRCSVPELLSVVDDDRKHGRVLAAGTQVVFSEAHPDAAREEALVGGVVFGSFGQVGPLVRRLVRWSVAPERCVLMTGARIARWEIIL